MSKEPKDRDRPGPQQVPDAQASDAADALDAVDFAPEELRDFLAADYLETQADPDFKESLRKKLWTLVKYRYGPGSSSFNSR